MWIEGKWCVPDALAPQVLSRCHKRESPPHMAKDYGGWLNMHYSFDALHSLYNNSRRT